MSSTIFSNSYQTYLLRLRQRSTSSETAKEGDPDSTADVATTLTEWQLILVHPYTGARRTFDSLEALMIFLQEQMADG